MKNKFFYSVCALCLSVVNVCGANNNAERFEFEDHIDNMTIKYHYREVNVQPDPFPEFSIEEPAQQHIFSFEREGRTLQIRRQEHMGQTLHCILGLPRNLSQNFTIEVLNIYTEIFPSTRQERWGFGSMVMNGHEQVILLIQQTVQIYQPHIVHMYNDENAAAAA